jgi:hypothetical protein
MHRQLAVDGEVLGILEVDRSALERKRRIVRDVEEVRRAQVLVPLIVASGNARRVPSNPRKFPRTVENIMCLTEKPTWECDASIAYVVVPVAVLVLLIGNPILLWY